MPRQSDTPKPAVTRARKPRATGTTPKTPRKKAASAVPSPSEAVDVTTAATSASETSPVSASAPEPAPALSHDAIAEAAYQRYLERGGSHGLDFDDWVEAERMLRERT